MTEAMPFLQKAILLSYDPLPLAGGGLLLVLQITPDFAVALQNAFVK